MKFILASKSPRRKEILEKGNFKFKIIPSNIDELSVSLVKVKPEEYCMKLATLKAKYISNQYIDYTIIGADTIVVIHDTILNKPSNSAEAQKMLKMLSDDTHQVITGVSLQNQKLNINHTFFEVSNVTFYKLDNNEINDYILDYKPFDKAGSYGIQDASSLFVKRIEGSYDNIMGFPLSHFNQLIKKIK